MKNVSVCLILCVLFYSCKKSNKIQPDDVPGKGDTIFAPSGYAAKEENCKKDMIGFVKKYNLFISRFYIVEKGLSFNRKDSMAIAKPFYVNTSSYGNCFPEESYGNLLLIYNSIDDHTAIFKNALYADSPDIFQELVPNKNGFTISVEKGNSSKIFSKVKVSYQSKRLYVDSISIESWGFKQYQKRYGFNNLKFENYSVKLMDSLQTMNEK